MSDTANSTLTNHGDGEAAAALHAAFPDVTEAPVVFRGDWRVHVQPEHEAAVITHARDVLGFQMFIDRMGADQGPGADPRFDVITLLYNLDTKRRLTVLTSVPEAAPELPTLCGVFRGANWFEREAFDMYGLIFTGHPNLTRILMPDEYDAFPMRKEYPMEGHGDWAAPRRALGGNVDGTDGRVAIPENPGQPGWPTRDPILADEDERLLAEEKALAEKKKESSR